MPNARDSPLALLDVAILGLALFAFTKRKRANGELGFNQQGITARADDVGPSDQSR